MPALLQEIVSVYPLLSPPNLTAHVSNRVCNALALLQCVASHTETRQLFLNGMSVPRLSTPGSPNSPLVAHIPLFLYPFLNTTSKTRPFEYLRLTSLGVIGALVKVSHHSLGLTPQLIFRSSPAKRQQHRHPLPSLHGNYTPLPPHHGDRVGTLENRRHLHRSKDPAGRDWLDVYLPHLRAILCRGYRSQQYG